MDEMDDDDMAIWYIAARANELKKKRFEFKSLKNECITAVIKNSKTYLLLNKHIFQILRKCI